MDWSGAFANIAAAFVDGGNGPFVSAAVLTKTAPVYDDGGDIVTPGTPVERSCLAQADLCGEAMRGEDGYADGDVQIIILCDTLDGAIDSDARVRINAGPFAGTWTVQSLSRDPVAVGWSIRGRRG